MRESIYSLGIVIISILVPALVMMIFYVAPPEFSSDSAFLNNIVPHQPQFHALLNGSVFCLLLASLYFIKNGRVKPHKACNITALILSAVFLTSYVVYHALTESTKYGGEGALKYIYYFILLSHILLSAIILPLVLFTFLRAFQERFDAHRKLARWTMPIWLYVSASGVLVYLLISPYY